MMLGQTCKSIFNTLEENPELDYSNVYVLTRIYEVNDNENIVQDITFATNSQNPVDLKDLLSNDEKQKNLELAAKELGYIYKRKRDINTSGNSIPISVAATAIASVWKDMPHIARYRKNDLFENYYEKIFSEINAAQMILAVLIFRFCDTSRKRYTDDRNISSFRGFETHFASKVFGKLLLQNCSLSFEKVTHKTFNQLLEYFETNKVELFTKAEALLCKMLQQNFSTENLYTLDGRTVAAPFRRFDLLIRYINNEEWWNEACKEEGVLNENKN